MFIEARSAKASAGTEHAGTTCHGKVAFAVMAAHISSHRHYRAGTSSLATAAFSASHALQPCFMFGASASMRHAIGRSAHAQSGRLSFGSLLTNRQRQSATRHRLVAGRPAAARAMLGALASQRTNIPQPWLAPPLLGARISQQLSSCKEAVASMVCRPRPKSLEAMQNVASQIQGGAGMQGRIINIHRQFGVFSSALASVLSLTGRSTGHQRAAHVAAG
jgi:hypothetical protein